MRATQFVRRGLIAFATVALFSTGLAGGASAQIGTGSIGCGSAGVSPDNDAIVVTAAPGYSCALLSTPGHGEQAILSVGLVPSAHPVAVVFFPDINGAAVLNPSTLVDDVIAERPE
jgi:hypothetical protein